MYDYDDEVYYNQYVNDDASQYIYADQRRNCFRTPQGTVCRDFRRGIECVYPRFGRPFCHRFRRF